ncbi:MAG TPA: hypothetical protein VFC77_02010 [Myxococcota bacterium]|nr:hypothetical protein [Myxococcota bacterium]
MPKRFLRSRILSCVPALAVAVWAGASAADTAYYTWQTEEGATAFADDLRSVPEAYRAQAQRRTLSKLSGYAQLTPSDSRAQAGYAARLDERLAYLRALNAPAAPREAAPGSGTSQTIALRTGGDQSPLIELTSPARDDVGPMIVETLRARPANRIATRNNIVVRQGDQTLAIIRSRGREWNVTEDIHIESDLE